jgi:hypothetical protein
MSKYVPPHLRNRPQPSGASANPGLAGAGAGAAGHGAARNAAAPSMRQPREAPRASASSRFKDSSAGDAPPTGSYMPPHMRHRPAARTPPNAPSSQRMHGANEAPSSASGTVAAAAPARRELTEEELLADEKAREDEEKQRHPDLNSEETVALGVFFDQHSETFKMWGEVRTAAYHNEHIGNFFEKKNANKSHSKREGTCRASQLVCVDPKQSNQLCSIHTWTCFQPLNCSIPLTHSLTLLSHSLALDHTDAFLIVCIFVYLSICLSFLHL